MIAFKHSYAELPSPCFARVNPTPVSAPQIIKINTKLATKLGFDLDYFKTSDATKIFSGNSVSENSKPIAMAYAGHQFGNWVHSLGDGRAILLGEIDTPEGVRFDIQLKGSGKTPFSRQGDGRAWLGPVLREYIVSEAMHHLGIPSTRSLLALTTGDIVYRERPLPGAILVRVSRSHIRVGTFQYFYARNDYNSLKRLADYLINRCYPEIKYARNPYLALLESIVERQIKLVVQWLGVGFIHGVMNTDNTSLSCETIDFGPCAFLDKYHPEKVFSSIDFNGRYSFSNQPKIMQWNLTQFAATLLPLIDSDVDVSKKLANEALSEISDLYETHWLEIFGAKLGIKTPNTNDHNLILEFLTAFQSAGCDFTKAFRILSELEFDAITYKAFEPIAENPQSLLHWLNKWKDRLYTLALPDLDRRKLMQRSNPWIIPRNHQIELAIQESLEGDYFRFNNLVEALKKPYKRQIKYAAFSKPPRSNEIVTKTHCGT